MHIRKKILIVCSIILLITSCKNVQREWVITIPSVTSASSPKCIDLNNDGIKDIIIGAGGPEWQETESGVIAIDGSNGKILWKAKARNQIVGSAIFHDINEDGTPDVIIGGRSAELQALDGKNGKLIWEFYTMPGTFNGHIDGWYNFFNPQLVIDQDNDKMKDFIICNGGDATIASGMKYRPSGKLLLVSGRTGKIIAQGLMPDGQETYFSIVCIDCSTNKNPSFIFGSGGESRPGHLYLASLNDLILNKLNLSLVLDSTTLKGYIAPPILVDMNHDNILDIVLNNSEGSTCLIDGKSHQKIWSVHIDSCEVYSQPAIGKFYGMDDYLDVYVIYAKGIYPDYSSTSQLLIDGKTGKIVKEQKDKRFVYSSPLVADIDGDGSDEIICNNVFDEGRKPKYELQVTNFKKDSKHSIFRPEDGACFASTPWIGDLDNDKIVDIIYTGSPAIVSIFPGNTSYQHAALALTLHRKFLPHVNVKEVKWGEYMGENSQSIMR